MNGTALRAAGKRDHQIDLVKTVAICFVLLIHCCFYTDPVGSAQWTQAVLLGSMVRPAVPLFLMCSGALLLPPEKELPLRRLLRHNLLRIFAAMLFWGMVYQVWHLLAEGMTLRKLLLAAARVLLFQQEWHFYYLHITILVYLFLPLTRLLVRHATREKLRYALCLWFAFGIVLPTVRNYPPFTLLGTRVRNYALDSGYAAIGYGLLGWYLKRYPLSRRMSAGLLGIGLAGVFGGTWLVSLLQGELFEGFFEGMNVAVCMMAAGLFCLLGQLAARVRRPHILAYLARASFCVYLIHVFFLNYLFALGFDSVPLPRLLLVPLGAAVLLGLSLLGYAVLSKIPVVRDWLI